MVTQNVLYFRFDKKSWLNPATKLVEEYMDYVDRYDISQQTISYKIMGDVDYKPDTINLIVAKSFFSNPLNIEKYSSGIPDPNNSFAPNNFHVIAVGPLYEAESGIELDSQMFFGSLQNIKDLGSDKLELEFWSFIKVLADNQCGNNYVLHNIMDEACNTLDIPNNTSTYYDYATYKEIQSGELSSDPGFAVKDTSNPNRLSYAVYSFSGVAIDDVDITIRYSTGTGSEFKEATYHATAGQTGEYIAEQFTYLLKGDFTINTSTEGVFYTSKRTLSTGTDTTVRMTVVNGCLVFETSTEMMY